MEYKCDKCGGIDTEIDEPCMCDFCGGLFIKIDSILAVADSVVDGSGLAL